MTNAGKSIILIIIISFLFLGGCKEKNIKSTNRADSLALADSAKLAQIDSTKYNNDEHMYDGREHSKSNHNASSEIKKDEGMRMIHIGMDMAKSGNEMMTEGQRIKDKTSINNGMEMMNKGMDMITMGKEMIKKEKISNSKDDMMDKGMEMMDNGKDIIDKGKDESSNNESPDKVIKNDHMRRGMGMMNKGMGMMDMSDKVKKDKNPISKDTAIKNGDK